jgi:transketolase
MRKELAKFLKEKMEQDPSVCLINGDCGQGLFTEIIREHPDRYWNFGVMEQATVAHIAGMANQGLKPWFYSITPFVLERPYEFIKLDVVAQNSNVKLVGYWDYPDAGITHETKNVLGVCNELGIRCYEPRSDKEARDFLEEIYQSPMPSFINLTKAPRNLKS